MPIIPALLGLLLPKFAESGPGAGRGGSRLSVLHCLLQTLGWAQPPVAGPNSLLLLLLFQSPPLLH